MECLRFISLCFRELGRAVRRWSRGGPMQRRTAWHRRVRFWERLQSTCMHKTGGSGPVITVELEAGPARPS